jgi:hypothetical protein
LSLIENASEPEPVDDGRALDELGLVQLAARLGASLEKRRAQLANRQVEAAAPAVAPLSGTEDFEAAGAEDAARAIADFFGPATADEPEVDAATPDPLSAPVAMPEPLRGLSLDGDDEMDDEAFAASFSLPLAGNPVSASLPVDEDEIDEAVEDEPDEAEFSSLLAMKNPFLREQEFVRVEEPEDEDDAFEPTVTFPTATAAPAPTEASDAPTPAPRLFDPPGNPGKSAPRAGGAPAVRDPADAEHNLRAALATLQRMSGAA